MSFILDALRKSDQQRQRSAAPTLASAQAPAAEPRQPALLWYGLIAGVLVGAGILIGWMQQTPAPSTALSSPAGRPEPAAVPPSNVMSPGALPELARRPDAPAAVTLAGTAPPVPTPLPAETAAAVAAGPRAPAIAPHLSSPAPAAALPTEVARPAESAGVGDAPREPTMMQFAELPPAIQQEIPKLSILAHSYSNKPKARFVFINDRMVHEEDVAAPGLRLEQITPDGMIFSYKGYRFHRAANAN